MTTMMNRCPTCQTPERHTVQWHRRRTLYLISAVLLTGITLGFVAALVLVGAA